MQLQTWVPLTSISEATWQLPITPRSRVAIALPAVFMKGNVAPCRGSRDFQQPTPQFIGISQTVGGRAGGGFADTDTDAAETIDHLERILVGHVIAGEDGTSAPKRLLLHQASNPRPLGQLTRADLNHTFAHQHRERRPQAGDNQFSNLEHFAA